MPSPKQLIVIAVVSLVVIALVMRVTFVRKVVVGA
jgi:hypothetical protein